MRRFSRYIGLVVSVLVCGTAMLMASPELVGFARIPADQTENGPTSGQFIHPINRRQPPFVLRQPVQGISALMKATGDRVLALSDNGFGTRLNSPDYVLSFRSLRLQYPVRQVTVERTFTLSDPFRRMPWPIVAEMETYPPTEAFPVDATIREKRLLTGADFDPESFAQAKDGTFWIGDEFGPFLLQTDLAGRLLRAPISLPGVFSPEHPLYCADANIASSRGLVGMTSDASGANLYLLLEGPVNGVPDPRHLRVYEFNTASARFTNRMWSYRLSDPTHAVGDLVFVDKLRFLVIERDYQQGAFAKFKKVFLADLEKGTRTEVVDLLAIADPKDLDGDGLDSYKMPFSVIDGITIVDRQTILVVNDNDYPFGTGRLSGFAEDTEFALIRLPKPIKDY